MRVVITDFTFPSLDIEEAILRPAGMEVASGQCKTPESLIALVADADAVITQFAPLTAQVISAMQKARVIVRYGIGVDNVDLAAAREKGIPVCNVPDYCIDEVADHTLAFILALTRQVLPNLQHIRDGKWGLPVSLSDMKPLRDLTVGVVGFGRIGREVASRLQPFKCRRLVHDPVVPAAVVSEAGCETVGLEALLAESDVVTLHCPSTPQTRQLINAKSILTMKPGAFIVNVARGDLIETPALIAALQSGKFGGAALDVCDPEPIPADSPLRSLPNVICSSHVASCSANAVRTLRETVARTALRALNNEPLANIVNGVKRA
ncbi:C-terminal binding protein [Zavarzinella formosa]|uniref:C-terminal binding protein n=1 Tax=Zavarzinella formosa TaxID=360055 RepID=UPI0002F94B31|nr:C-terminal binding protein [Zavarzinella formosa]